VLHGPRLFGQPTCHHAPEVYPGIGEGEAAALLREFSASAGPEPQRWSGDQEKSVFLVETVGRPSASSAGRYLNRSSMISQVALSSLR
jgi:hypothetical protein